MFNFWWSARLVHGLKPHLPPISSPKNEMLIFGLCSMSDDWPGWWMDSNPIRHPSPANKMKCSFLDYVQLLMISQAGSWTQTPFATHLQPKKWNAHFWIMLNVWWLAGLVNGLKPHPPPLSSQKNEMLGFGLRSTSDDWPGWWMDSNLIPSPLSLAKKLKCSYLDYVQLLMIGWAGQWTQTPSANHLKPEEWNAQIWITFNFWWSAGLVNGLKPHLPPISSQKMNCSVWDYVELLMIGWAGWWTQTPSTIPLQPKNEMLIFGLRSTSDDQPGWFMDSNPICHPSPAQKMKRSFLDYAQCLMISRAGGWTQTPSATSLQPKKWNAHFWITFNFWWSARLVHGLKPHLPPISSPKNEMLIFGLRSMSDDWPGWSMDSNPIRHPSPAKKWNAHFWITFNFWWLAGLVDGLKPHPLSPLSGQKIEMLIFGLCSTSDDRLGWSMDSNPICKPSKARRMKCSDLDYVQLLMISWAGQWTQTPFATHLQPKNELLSLELRWTSDDRLGWLMDSNPIHHPSSAKKWNAHFWIMLNVWWLARLVDGLKPHPPPLSSQKNETLIFGLRSTSDDQLGWSMDSNPICHPSPAKKWIAQFGITLNFWWSAGLVHGLKPHLPPISSPKNEMLIFGLRSMSDDRPGWWMDSNPIHHPSPAKKMKCSFLDYVQLLMISQAGSWTQTPFATHLQPKKWNAHFRIMLNVWWSAGQADGLKPHPPPLSRWKKIKCSFLDYVELLMIGRAGQWTQTPSATHLQPKKLNAHFLIMFNFWWSARLVDGLKPHPPPLSSQKKKYSFLEYVQLLMVSQAGSWIQTPFATPLQPKNEMLIFGICSTSDGQPGWLIVSNPIHHPSSAKKMKCSFLDCIQLLMLVGLINGQWTPSATHLQPNKWNAHFWIIFNFYCWPGWLMELNPICHPSPAKKMKCLFLDYVHFWWSNGLVDGLKPHPPPLSSQKKWNAWFWITFNFWWLAGLVDGLKPHPLSPLSGQKKWNAHIWIMFNFWWSAGLVNGLKPHLQTI